MREGKTAIVGTFRQNFDSGDTILNFETVASASDEYVAWSSQIWNFSRGKVHLTSGWTKNSAGEWLVQTETSVALKGLQRQIACRHSFVRPSNFSGSRVWSDMALTIAHSSASGGQ